MGFPVPLKEWFSNEARNFIVDTFSSLSAKNRNFTNSKAVIDNFEKGARFSRKTWGLLALELWQQEFHDQHKNWKKIQ